MDQDEEDSEDACFSGFQAKNRVLKGGWHDLSEEPNDPCLETKSAFRWTVRSY